MRATPASSSRSCSTSDAVASFEVGTSQGPALLDWTAAAAAPAPFVMALTHGAGGTVGAPDLLAAGDAAAGLGGGVALVTQPYRVRGARAPGSAGRQDEAWTEIVIWLRSSGPAAAAAQPPLIVGGRSNGARVACRTAEAVEACGVLALAFPLQPPARRTRGSDELTFPPDRSAELAAAAHGGAHVLVLNGDRDSFGIPAASDSTRVVVLKGETHSLSKKPAAVSAAVAAWLADLTIPVR
jgi:uncharacterized protein